MRLTAAAPSLLLLPLSVAPTAEALAPRSVARAPATATLLLRARPTTRDDGIDIDDRDEDDGIADGDGRRRRAIFGGAASSVPYFFGSTTGSGGGGRKASAADVGGNEDEAPLADFPMRRLRLPTGGLGREYVIVQLYIQGKGPFDFMVDSGLTTEMITPHLQQVLHLEDSSGITKRGLSAGAVGQTQSLIKLDGVSLCCGKFLGGGDFFELPGPLNAIVTDFPQEHMDPAHDPVEGMIGMEVLEQFDVDFDFPAGRLRLWKPHTVERVARKAGMSAIDAVVVNETLLLGFRVVPSSARKDESGAGVVLAQPFLGVVDCGASFSVVNRAAAPLLGLPSSLDDDFYKRGPAVAGIGVDGRPQLLPTTEVRLSYCGNAVKGGGGSMMSFEAPPGNWVPWDPVSVAVGDLPVFSQLLGDGRSPYRGPAGIIGLDVLSQRRVILETDTKADRKRRIYISNK